ncbi:hypothetical protein GALMADRAFT_1079775 [Galerina marginata CBS 339.88]|uniref:F-box domain-containing protein n=1 Tax=Galerina marginata (strain CBS 339.88) TaxID=685588 RepID=A0A067SC47_GALM3|nr:hypothetical protein GALMADRAFT_1079775 [Galerina marginata CBS 339.88]
MNSSSLPLLRSSCNIVLPPEMFQEISSHLAPSDVLSLSLISRYFHHFLQPVLYHSLDLKSFHCRHVLRFLLRRSYPARYIRKLVLRPSYHYLVSGMTSERAKKKEAEVLRIFHGLVPCLRSLHTFVWDGLFSPGPMHDGIWSELKRSCPKLRNVGSVLGWREAINPDTKLFSFQHLKSFSLIPKYREIDAVSMTDCPSAHDFAELPKDLCEMIAKNSLDLERLTIGCPTTSCNERVFDLRPLMHAYWPKLESLTLGQTYVSAAGPSEDESPSPSATLFSSFIGRHRQSLKRLSIPRHIDSSQAAREHSYPSMTLDSMTSSLEKYAGPLPLSINPKLDIKANSSGLQDLSLCLKPLAFSDMAPLRELLKCCTSLMSLAVWVDFTQDVPDMQVGHTGALGTMLEVSPGLTHLDIRCSTQRAQTFRAIDIHQALLTLPSIQVFKLTKVSHKNRFYDADDMLKTVLRIVRFTSSASTLQKISLWYAWKPWNSYDTIGMIKVGTYDVVHPMSPLSHIPFIKAEECNQEHLEAHLGECRAANILAEVPSATYRTLREVEHGGEMYFLHDSIASMPLSRLSTPAVSTAFPLDSDTSLDDTHTNDCYVPQNGCRAVCVCPHRRYVYDSTCPSTPSFSPWDAPSPPLWAMD